MRAKRIQLLLLTIAISFSVKAQIPPSPDASALAEYANTSVNLFTGALKISVPIWDINFRGINMPISLTYNPSGIKVEAIASRVGLGWSLNAGGLITRAVLGLPDDYSVSGFLASDIAKQVNDFDLTATTDLQVSKLNSMCTNGYDLQPDVFFFNFNGKVGKFVFNDKKEIKLIPYQNIQLSYTLNSNGQIISFKAITEEGTQYIFDKVDVTTITTTAGYIWNILPSVTNLVYNSSWYLTKIISAFGEEINLNYELETIQYDLRTSQYNYMNYENFLANYTEFKVLKTNFNLNNWRLSQIYSNTFQIDFLYNGIQRQDLPGSLYLNTIKISSIPLNLIKEYYLDFSYFTSLNATSSLFYRLKLNSIQESKGSATKPPIVFKYNDNNVYLPNRLSCEQDLWGYYNANQATTLFPKLYIYPDLIGNDRFRVYPKSNYNGTSFYLDQGANRLPNDAVIQYCVLNEIEYPTGGFIKYTYEPNDFYYGGEKLTGCGIRVSKTELSDGVNSGNNIITNYSYKETSDATKSSGRLFRMPVFASLTNSIYWDDQEDKYMDLSDINFDYSSIDYYKKFLFFSSSDMSVLGSSIGNNFGYKTVTVDIGGKGKSVYTYSVPGTFGQVNDCYDPSDASCSCILSESGYCDGLFHSYKMNYIHKKTTCTAYLDNLDLTLNFIPFIYDWNRGFLINKKDYNNNNLVKETSNSYKVFYSNGNSAEIIYGIHKDQLVPYLYSDINGGPCENENLYAFSKYYFLTQVAKVLESSTETIYDSNNSNKSVSTTTTYTYNSLGQVSSISQTQSDGSTITTFYKYPSDYNPGFYCLEADNMAIALRAMVDKNISNIPIETYTTKGGKVIDGSINTFMYDFPNSIVLPENQYKLYLQTPLPTTDFTKSFIQTQKDLITLKTCDLKFSFNSSYKPVIAYDAYDWKGNLLQFHKTDDINTSYIWGYNQTQPIAEVKNAGVNEIFYSGFEDTDDINAWFPSNLVLDGAVLKTGRKSIKIVNSNISESSYFSPFFDISNASDKKYKYSCWVYSNGPSADLYFFMKPNTDNQYYSAGWTCDYRRATETNKWIFLEGEITVPSSMKRIYLRMDNNGGGTVWFDDVRLRPSDAQMTTYTYDPLIGITSATDNNNRITYYNYDGLGRLVTVKDEDGNILNSYKYHYQEQ